MLEVHILTAFSLVNHWRLARPDWHRILSCHVLVSITCRGRTRPCHDTVEVTGFVVAVLMRTSFCPLIPRGVPLYIGSLAASDDSWGYRSLHHRLLQMTCSGHLEGKIGLATR